MKAKICTKCKKEKSLSAFSKGKRNKGGYSTWCKLCVHSYNEVYYSTFKVKIKKKRYKLKQYYGITGEDYDEMYFKQQGCCVICGIHQSELKKSLCVDYQHSNGQIRGLLCHNCNCMLGNAKEIIKTLENAIKYLGVCDNGQVY